MSERQKEHSCFERQKKLACVSVYSLFPKVAPWKRVLRVFGVWNNTKPLEDEILSTLFVSMQPSPHVATVLSFEQLSDVFVSVRALLASLLS